MNPFVNNKALVRLKGKTVHETGESLDEGAVLLQIDGALKPIWFPKSQLEDWPDRKEYGDIIMPEWLAKEKEVI